MPETASITPSLAGQVWLKSIRHPFLNRPVTTVEFTDPARASRTGVFEVKGRSHPVTVTDIRGSQSFPLELMTTTAEQARDMDLTLASGSTFFVHVPKGCTVPGGYVDIGDTAQERRTRSARSDRRYFTLPCRVVAQPGPDIIGGTMTWGALLNLYGGWNNVLAANPSWRALLDNVASPEDLVVL